MSEIWHHLKDDARRTDSCVPACYLDFASGRFREQKLTGHPYRLQHARLAGRSLTVPCPIKGRSMRGTGSNEWQPESDINCRVEPEQFHRDMPLVMIHGNHAIKFSKHSSTNQSVDRQGAMHVAASCTMINRRCDDMRFFISEKSMLAAVRIQGTHGNGSA